MIDWINNFFGVDNEISVPTITSITIFLVGGIATYSYSSTKAFLERKKHRRVLIDLLNEVARKVKVNESNILDFNAYRELYQ
jgi:hypothetical protein